MGIIIGFLAIGGALTILALAALLKLVTGRFRLPAALLALAALAGGTVWFRMLPGPLAAATDAVIGPMALAGSGALVLVVLGYAFAASLIMARINRLRDGR